MTSSPPSRQRLQVERDALLAVMAEGSLSAFVRAAWAVLEPGKEFLPNWHLEAVCEHLEAVTAGELTRLIVNIPPRYGKSTLVSVCWPVWEWLRDPGRRFIFASYADRLSLDLSLKRRWLVQSPWHAAHFGGRYALSGDQNAKVEFQNDRRGHMIATSVGGSPHGRGADVLVIDDPHNPTQAQSDAEREAANTFFDANLYSRLDDKKRGAIVVVMQRLHERDLTGYLLAKDAGDMGGEWTHLSLPGIAEADETILGPRGGRWDRRAGEPLWPDREDVATLERTRRTMTPRVFAGQYQQRPAPRGGELFPRERFEVVPAIPARVRARCRSWDKSATPGGGDWTAGVLVSVDHDGVWYVEDVRRGQWSTHDREAAIKNTAARDGRSVVIRLEQEPGSAGKDMARIGVAALSGYRVHAERATGPKEVRAEPFACQVQAGNVRLVAGPWNEAFLAEAELFPNGAHDDQVDAASSAFAYLALNHSGSRFIGATGPNAGKPRYQGMAR